MNEWKQIIIDGKLVKSYAVSDQGQVSSTKYRKIKILKAGDNGLGRLQVTLCIEGKLNKFLVYRLVAEAFIPNPDSLPFVDHIDCNPLNNTADNLRWTTNRINLQNRKARKEGKTTSKFVGVHFSNHSKKWIAKIYANNKSHNLGSFTTEEDAAFAYDSALIELGLESVNLPA